MKNHIPDNVVAWLGPAIIIIIGAFVIVGNPIGQELFCEKTQNCLATWVGALSGWAAAFAAAITISSLFQQARAAQKQTDFQLGDAEPTFDAVQHGERKARVILQIRNWNRRAMIIRRIRLLTKQEVTTLHIAFYREKRVEERPMPKHEWTFSKGGSKKFDPALMIEGWVSRDKEPPLMKLGVAGFLQGRIEITNDWQHIPIEIQYELAGLRQVSRLTAHVHLASASITEDFEGIDNYNDDEAVGPSISVP